MEEKERNELLKKAEGLMQPGCFQHAYGIYESLDMKEKMKEASLACAKNCLETGRYALAILYFKKGGEGEKASNLEDLFKEEGIELSLDIEKIPACTQEFYGQLCPKIEKYIQRFKE